MKKRNGSAGASPSRRLCLHPVAGLRYKPVYGGNITLLDVSSSLFRIGFIMKAIGLTMVIFGLALYSSTASERDTANYLSGEINRLDGTMVKVDVAHLNRIKYNLPNNPEIAILHALTYDETHHIAGGIITLVVNVEDVPSLLDRYGVYIRHDGGNVQVKPLKGVLGHIQLKNPPDLLFLNLSSMTHPETLPLAHATSKKEAKEPENAAEAKPKVRIEF